MKTKHFLLSGLALATPLLLSMDPRGDSVTFAPAEGSTLSKTYVVTQKFTLDDMTMAMNGEEMDPAMMGVDLDEASGEVSATLEFTDEYVAMDGARHKELKRTFGSMVAEYATGDGESGSESNDEMEGKTIVFKLDAESGEYALTDGDGEEIDEEMQILSVDTDLTVFLPAGEVEEDASWTIEGADLMRVFVPGVNIDKAMAKLDEEASKNDAPFAPSDFMDFMGELGSIECTYKGTKEVEGTTLQVISLVPTLEKEIDLTDMISEIIDMSAPGQDISASASITLEGTGSGELLWDAKAGHFVEYTLDIQISALITGSGESQGMGGGIEVETTTNLGYHFTAK
ncbi:MAG: hypothetical protein KDB61_01950 [Planctomycetes bacterium]|nr:hypothetical protein [Planctomycetota bacterium]